MKTKPFEVVTFFEKAIPGVAPSAHTVRGGGPTTWRFYHPHRGVALWRW